LASFYLFIYLFIHSFIHSFIFRSVEKHTHQLGLLRCANSQRVSLLESAKYHALQKASRCRHLANYYDTWKHSSRDSSWHSRNTNYSKSKKFKKVIKYFQFSAHVFNFHAGTIRLLGSAVPWGALKPILLPNRRYFSKAPTFRLQQPDEEEKEISVYAVLVH